ncbi:hypothetical protein OAA60_05535 [Porticoccaceae bacterium]|nr:hypothetical protein [Porticoccaceae bacterium]
MKHNKNKELSRITEDKDFHLFHFINGVKMARKAMQGKHST